MASRDYQAEAVRSATDCLHRHRSTLIVLPTGMGKTHVMGHLAGLAKKRVLVVAHRDELVRQNADKIGRVTGKAVDIEMGEMLALEGLLHRAPVVSASKDSLHPNRISRFNPFDFGLVLVDECFPAGTPIGGVPIENVRVGDLVDCFDHATSRIVKRPVARLFRNPCHSLVLVTLSSGRRVACTPQHPFWTNRGYRPASDLASGDVVYCTTHAQRTTHDEVPPVRDLVLGEKQLGNGSVSGVLLQAVQGGVVAEECVAHGSASVCPVWHANNVQGSQGIGDGAAWTGVLLGCVSGRNGSGDQFGDDGSHQSGTGVGPHVTQQPHEESRFKSEDGYVATGPDLSGQRRQWGHHSASGGFGGGVGSPHGARNSHVAGSGAIPVAAQLLQGGHRQPGRAAGDRGGRQDPSAATMEVLGSSQDGGLERARVDRVEILESGRDGRFGGLCPDGLVYNIEVEEHHNYFANGVLVHNCHHATAKTYTRIFDHFRGCKVVGVTATPDRADEAALGKVFESVAYEMSIRDGIERGWLVPVRQRKIACESLDFSGVRKVGGDFNQGQLADLLEQEGPLHEMTVPTLEVACGVARNTIDTLLALDPATATEAFRAKMADRKRTLIFCSRVHHAELVTHILNRWLPGSAAIVHGKTPPEERASIFNRFGAGEIQFLANVGIATEGWDDPATDGRGVQIVSLMRPTQSRSLYAQMIGRGTRPLPGLVDAFEDAPSRVAAIAASPKPSVLILDFHDLADTHSLIHAEDVLGGSFDDKVVDKAKSKTKSKGGSEEEETDVLEVLVEADEDLAKAAEDERRQRIRAGVRYSEQDVDPFAAVGRRPKRVPGWFVGRPASEKQINLLKRFGLWNPNVITNMGIASQVIDGLAANGWKRPKVGAA